MQLCHGKHEVKATFEEAFDEEMRYEDMLKNTCERIFVKICRRKYLWTKFCLDEDLRYEEMRR